MEPCKSDGFVYVAFDSGPAIQGDPVLGLHTYVMATLVTKKLAVVVAQASPGLYADIHLRRAELIDARACDKAEFGLARSNHPALLALNLPVCAVEVAPPKPEAGCPSWAFTHVTYKGDQVEAVVGGPEMAGNGDRYGEMTKLVRNVLLLTGQMHWKIHVAPDKPWPQPGTTGSGSPKFADEKDERARCAGYFWVKRTATALQ